MVEVGNNLDPDEEFDFLQNILDFPLECLEEDEGLEDWDLNNPQCLGPIPSDVLMGTPMISDEIFNSKSPSLFPRPVAPIPPERKFAKVQESASFCTQSPVSILESSGSYSREKSLPIKSDNALPLQSRSKRVINPSLLSRKRIFFQQPAAMDLVESSSRNVDSSLDGSDPAHLQNTSKPRLLVKKCAHCETTKTTQWRWGPLGQNTLCNACGVRFRSGRLFPEYRPASSPTFDPSQHSNSHGKVEEMRKNAERLSLKIKIKIVRAPEQMHPAEQADTSCSLLPPENVGAPEQEQLTKHIDIDTFVGVPQGKQLTKHDDTSSSHKSPQTAGVIKRKQLMKYAVSHVPPQVARVPEHKQLADHVNISSSSEKSSSTMSTRLTSNARASKECRKKSCLLPVAMDVSKNDENSLAISDPRPAVVKKCAHCQSTKTPQWRSGPMGRNTLCNACGLRIRCGCLLPEYRPAASPTFVPSQHSNRQSKVVKMRINATRVATAESKQDIIYISDSEATI